MVAVAIYSADSAFRLRLEQLLRAELGYTVASVTHDPAAVSQLIEQRRVDTVVAHVPSCKLLTKWRNRRRPLVAFFQIRKFKICIEKEPRARYTTKRSTRKRSLQAGLGQAP
jgi:hypothetical protein